MQNHISEIQNRNAITIARHRIDSGFYDSPAVIDETMRRLQSHLCIAVDYIELEREQAEWDRINDGDRFEGQS